MNSDFKDLLRIFAEESVEYLVVWSAEIHSASFIITFQKVD